MPFNTKITVTESLRKDSKELVFNWTQLMHSVLTRHCYRKYFNCFRHHRLTCTLHSIFLRPHSLFYLRPLDSRTRTSLAVFSAIVIKIDTKECFIVLHFKPGKLALLSLSEKVKPSSDRKKITLLTIDNSFPSLQHSR